MARTIGDSPATAQSPRRLSRRDWRAWLHLMLHGFGFLASTLLITWGLFFLFFLMLGGFSFDGFMLQLNNLTVRYVAADSARTSAFLNVFAIAHMILSTAVITIRRERILPDWHKQGAPHHG